jgi:hypothetical protein
VSLGTHGKFRAYEADIDARAPARADRPRLVPRTHVTQPLGPATLSGVQPIVRVRLLGQLDLRLDGAALPRLDSARAESLLAYLLLHSDAPQTRQHLAFLLLPGSTESQARTNLRHVLHTLRRSLPNADRYLLKVTPRTLQWRTEAPLWLDVAAFEALLAQAGSGGMPEWLADQLVILWDQLQRGAAATTTDVVQALTGREPRTVARYARDHAEAFRP